MKFTKRASFLIDNLDLPAASGVEGARFEHFQLKHFNDNSIFRVENKSRQIAWSFTVAAEAMADAILSGQSSLFVSINLDEATEKIRYARAVYDSLQIGGLPKITRDNVLTIELDNGARLISMPSKPPRGKARMNVYLDEFAHAQHDKLIYTAALPVISKGGRLRIGSSPLGASGVFWEVFSEELRQYSAKLAAKPELVVANKMDLTGSLAALDELRGELGVDMVGISAVAGEGLDRLLEQLWTLCRQTPAGGVEETFPVGKTIRRAPES